MIGRVVIGGALTFFSALFFAVPTVTVTYTPPAPRTGDTVTFTIVARSTTGAKQARPKLVYKFDAAWIPLASTTTGVVRAVATGVDSGRMVATWQRSDGSDVADTVWVKFASALPPPPIAGVSLTPLSVYLLPKQTQQFTGLAWAAGAATPIAGAQLRWSLSDSAVGSLDSTGMFTALTAGATNVRVEGGSAPNVKSETAVVTVVPLTGGAKTDTVLVPSKPDTIRLPGKVDTVYTTDPLLDTVLTDALLTPYRDSIRMLRDSIAKLMPMSQSSRVGCPDSLAGALVVRFADATNSGIVVRSDIAPVVVCGSARIAYAMQTYVAWVAAGPCPCRGGPVNDPTPNPIASVVLSPADTSAGAWDVPALTRTDSLHWMTPASARLPWKLLGGMLYNVVTQATVPGDVQADSTGPPPGKWWSYVPTQSGMLKTTLAVNSAIGTAATVLDMTLIRSTYP